MDDNKHLYTVIHSISSQHDNAIYHHKQPFEEDTQHMNRKFFSTKLDEISALTDQSLQSEGVGLPESIPYAYWNHAAKRAAEPWNRGGWSIPEDVMNAAITAVPGRAIPKYFIVAESDYGIVYHSEKLILAPFAKRERWINTETGEAKPNYFPGARLHRQVAAALADTVDDELQFWGIVYVTAKGMVWKSFDESMRNFTAATQQARNEFSQKHGLTRTLSANLLYRTMGDISGRTLTVGKGNATSIISLIDVKLKDTYSIKDIEMLLIEDTALDAIHNFVEDHQTWLHAWDVGAEANDEKPVQQPGQVFGDEVPF